MTKKAQTSDRLGGRVERRAANNWRRSSSLRSQAGMEQRRRKQQGIAVALAV